MLDEKAKPKIIILKLVKIIIKYWFIKINSVPTKSIMSVMNENNDSETAPPIKHNPLEQFVLLAKGAKGAACLELIKQVLEAPGVHVFGELLAMPNIAEVCRKLIKKK